MAFLKKLGSILGKKDRPDPAEEQLEKAAITNLSYLPKEFCVNLTTLFSFMELPQDDFESFLAAMARLDGRGNILQIEHRLEGRDKRDILYVKLVPTLWEHLWSRTKSTQRPEFLEQLERARKQMLNSKNLHQ